MTGARHVDEFFYLLSEEEQILRVLEQIERDADEISRALQSSSLPKEAIASTLRDWQRAFNRCVDRRPTREGILLASTANVDALCRMTSDGVDRAFLEAAFVRDRHASLDGGDSERAALEVTLDAAGALSTEELERQTSQAALGSVRKAILDLIRDPDPPPNPTTPAEIVGYALRGVVSGEDSSFNKKPFVPHQCLVSWLERVFGPSQRVVGGASATINNHMAKRGVPSAALATGHFSPQLASLHHEKARVVRGSESGGGITTPSAQESGRPGDLTKVHVPLEWVSGDVFRCRLGDYHAVQSDRIIFRTARWWDEEKKAWAEGAWKPGLAHCGLGAADVLSGLAGRFQGAILSGLQYVRPGAGEAMGHELDAIKGRVRMHVEFSGEPKNAQSLRLLLRGRVSSFGIGEELQAVLGALGVPSRCGRGSFGAYLDGLALAEEFQLERVYVHRATADVILRKHDGSRDELKRALREEIEGNLHAKHVTMCWVCGEGVGRTINRVSDLLRREGIEDLVDFVEQLTALHPEWDNIKKERVSRELLTQGYFVPEEPDHVFGVGVVPVKWTYGITNPVTTSVGDVSSGFSFAYGGYV